MASAWMGPIAYYLPREIVDNETLASASKGGWSADRIHEKTGIRTRHVAAPDECASDLAVAAATQLSDSGVCVREDIDYLLFCTQSPDYFLPTTACLIQDRLGLRTSIGALDFNLGCSGFVYGLGLAKGLVETGQARRVLLLTAETYSKHMHPGDLNVRTLFGDAAAAVVIEARDDSREGLGPFVFGTDGSGGERLIVRTGGMRSPRDPSPQTVVDERGNARTINDLYMDGAEIFGFTLRAVHQAVADCLAAAALPMDAVDLFVFHQANEYMLSHLRRKCQIPADRFVVDMEDCGNTVSSTIPIVLARAAARGQLTDGMRVMLVGFGVGYSWSAALARWDQAGRGC